MKQLRTDRQTLNDLGVMESTYGEKTLFSLFDMTESDGGKEVSGRLGNPPIPIGRCCMKGRGNPVSGLPRNTYLSGRAGFYRVYLSQGDRPTRVTYLESVLSRAFRVFRSTPERYIIQRGTKLLENVLLELKIFADHVTELSPRLIRAW